MELSNNRTDWISSFKIKKKKWRISHFQFQKNYWEYYRQGGVFIKQRTRDLWMSQTEVFFSKFLNHLSWFQLCNGVRILGEMWQLFCSFRQLLRRASRITCYTWIIRATRTIIFELLHCPHHLYYYFKSFIMFLVIVTHLSYSNGDCKCGEWFVATHKIFANNTYHINGSLQFQWKLLLICTLHTLAHFCSWHVQCFQPKSDMRDQRQLNVRVY